MGDRTGGAAAGRENNFGLLRLIFATLVIVSHSPELIDGNRSREILTRIFGTLSFGEVAVRGFFVISGFLITKSFVEGGSTRLYLLKRTVRIVPGFLVSFLACALILAPCVGGDRGLSFHVVKDLAWRALTLRTPAIPGAFGDLPYPSLNGAMWTIGYEFRCYLAVAVLGLAGLFKPNTRWVCLIAAVVMIVVNAAGVSISGTGTILDDVLGNPRYTIELGSVFAVGGLFYLFREKITLNARGALGAGVLLVAFMFSQRLADAAFAVFGTYLILWFALKVRLSGASRIGNKTDISYGLYLYAWPIQNLLIWMDRGIDPWVLCVLSLIGASVLGYLSWVLIEHPALQCLPARRRAGVPALV